MIFLQKSTIIFRQSSIPKPDHQRLSLSIASDARPLKRACGATKSPIAEGLNPWASTKVGFLDHRPLCVGRKLRKARFESVVIQSRDCHPPKDRPSNRISVALVPCSFPKESNPGQTPNGFFEKSFQGVKKTERSPHRCASRAPRCGVFFERFADAFGEIPTNFFRAPIQFARFAFSRYTQSHIRTRERSASGTMFQTLRSCPT